MLLVSPLSVVAAVAGRDTSASARGGAVYLEQPSLTLRDCDLLGNVVADRRQVHPIGSAVYTRCVVQRPTGSQLFAARGATSPSRGVRLAPICRAVTTTLAATAVRSTSAPACRCSCKFSTPQACHRRHCVLSICSDLCACNNTALLEFLPTTAAVTTVTTTPPPSTQTSTPVSGVTPLRMGAAHRVCCLTASRSLQQHGWW